MATDAELDVELDAAQELAKRVPITLTHVQYTEGDVVGYVLAWFSLLPIFLLISFVTMVSVRRDLQTIFFLAGIVLNEASTLLLKYIIRAPRPSSEMYPHNLFVEYGMPSSHAAFMAFFTTYFSLLLFTRILLSNGVMDHVWKAVAAGVGVVITLVCCFSRHYLGYHTVPQLACGVLVGIVMAGLWFALVQVVCAPYFCHVYMWRVSEILLLKDMSRIPNYLWFEYTSVRGETRKRLRSKSKLN